MIEIIAFLNDVAQLAIYYHWEIWFVYIMSFEFTLLFIWTFTNIYGGRKCMYNKQVDR